MSELRAVEYSSREGETKGFARRFMWAAAVLCAFLPMAVGLLILLLYWLIRWQWLPFAGFFWLAGGVVLLLLGATFLFITFIQDRKFAAADDAVRHPCKRVLLALLLNIPIAIFCTLAGSHLMTRIVVEVSNETGSPVDSWQLAGAVDTALMPRIAPHSMARTVAYPEREGALRVVFTRLGHTEDVEVLGYADTDVPNDSARLHIPEKGRPKVDVLK